MADTTDQNEYQMLATTACAGVIRDSVKASSYKLIKHLEDRWDDQRLLSANTS